MSLNLNFIQVSISKTSRQPYLSAMPSTILGNNIDQCWSVVGHLSKSVDMKCPKKITYTLDEKSNYKNEICTRFKSSNRALYAIAFSVLDAGVMYLWRWV